MVRPRLNFELEEARREYQRQYQREYHTHQQQQQQQQTKPEREQQRITENQGHRQRYARSVEITVEQLETKNRDQGNVDRNNRWCTSKRFLHQNAQSCQVQHFEAQPTHIFEHPPNTNNQLNIENVSSSSIECVPETPQHGSDIHVDLELENDRENMPNPNGMLQSEFRRFQM